MYYIKIPLRHLVKPEQLRVPIDQQNSEWQKKARSLLQDIQNGVVPSWAVDYKDLQAIELQEED